jgi:hypothetical protein
MSETSIIGPAFAVAAHENSDRLDRRSRLDQREQAGERR